MAESDLPPFTSHGRNIKTRPLDLGPREPSDVVRRLVRTVHARAGVQAGAMRVLDVGCGRGDTVAWLCAQGFDAYGVDVDDSYLEHGRAYLAGHGYGDGRLRLVVDGRFPFDDCWFDLVLSDQVLEHVTDLEAFVSEVSRVSADGGAGQHVFPARWRPVEVHMRTPLVHWLPKGRARRAGLQLALRAGAAAPYFTELPPDQRLEVFARYSETETYYRPLHRVVATFARYGMRPQVRRPSQDRVADRAPFLPAPALPAAGWMYRTAFSVCLETTRSRSRPQS
jgi:SAM-dependent methyltransferase